jgi:hypothetical protein
MRALVMASLACAVSACAVFEEPIDPSRDAGGFDAGVFDAGALADAATDAGVDDAGRAVDGGMDGGTDGGVDAGMDAGSADSGIVIPVRPVLSPCGFGAPVEVTTLIDSRFVEISGLVASRNNPRVFWMVEDSGSPPTVHAFNDMGRLVATYSVSGAAVDYEDLSIGPGPMAGVDYLYIGDIGDNAAARGSISVIRAPEPVVAFDQAFVSRSLTAVEPIPMRYPPGEVDNAEALFVDPATQDIYVITQNGFTRPNTVFRLSAPHTPAVPREMERLGGVYGGERLPPPPDVSITGASISADGMRITLRSLRSVNYWDRPAGMSIPDTLFTQTPCAGPLGAETKGEAISIAATGYYHISEGTNPSLYFVPFAP